MNQSDSQAAKDIERHRIDRVLAALEETVSRCREEDGLRERSFRGARVLDTGADEKWPFEQFRGALANAGMDTTKPEARWQVLKCLAERNQAGCS